MLCRALLLAFSNHLEYVSESMALFQLSNYVDSERLRGLPEADQMGSLRSQPAKQIGEIVFHQQDLIPHISKHAARSFINSMLRSLSAALALVSSAILRFH